MIYAMRLVYNLQRAKLVSWFLTDESELTLINESGVYLEGEAK